MLRSAIDPEVQSFIEFLNERYPTDKDAVVVVLPGYDSVMDPTQTDENGEPAVGWACYDPQACVLWIPGVAPQIEGLAEEEIRRIRFEHIAHEFVHHLQNCGGREFNEDEAEQLAQKIVDEWLASGGGR